MENDRAYWRVTSDPIDAKLTYSVAKDTFSPDLRIKIWCHWRFTWHTQPRPFLQSLML